MGKKKHGKGKGPAQPSEVKPGEVKQVPQSKVVATGVEASRLDELDLLQTNLDDNAIAEASPLRAYVERRRKEIEGEVAPPKVLSEDESAREDEVAQFERFLDSRGIGTGDPSNLSRQYVRRRHADLLATEPVAAPVPDTTHEDEERRREEEKRREEERQHEAANRPTEVQQRGWEVEQRTW
jgi:hypothetical protein